MLKKFLPLLQKREDKSGIIVVSSVAGDSPIPALTTYSASKAYLSYLSAAVDQEIQAEEKSKIDMQVLCPYFVATDMVSDVSIPLSFLTVASAESVVKSSLRQLGQKRGFGEPVYTGGTLSHDLLTKLLVTVSNNTPMIFTRYIGYFFYDKPKSTKTN